MLAIKKILFPVDLSENSGKMVPYVLTMAQAFNAEVQLLFVARVFEHYANICDPPIVITNFQEGVVRGSKRRLEEFSKEFFEGSCIYQTKILTGDPSREIVKHIESEGFDLVIIGSHGSKGLNHILFGSVADHVVKMSPVPVLSVNPHRTGP
jgi:nucleotide-binding universal stress UspA family protein